MTTYKVAEGFNAATADFADISPQPKSQGIRPTRRTFSGDATINDEGSYCELEFSALQDETEYQALLTQFGIESSLSAQVSVYIRNGVYTFGYYNAIVVQPEPGKEVSWDFFPKNVIILLRNLESYTP